MLIPVNVNDLPTTRVALDEGQTYTVTIVSVDPIKNDKNNDPYFAIGVQVIGPADCAGERLFDSYIPIPTKVNGSMTAGERRRVLNRAVKYSRFAHCFKLAGPDGLVDLDTAIGKEGTVTIRNEEYEGDVRTRIANYLF